MENSHFIHAYHLNKSGKTQALTPDNNTTLPEPKQGYYWLHMCALSADTREYLENNTDLEPIVIDAMLAEETRPRTLVKDKWRSCYFTRYKCV